MANRTVKEAKNIHGTNPQYLVEKIIRSRIYDSKFWKEQCFALTAELLVDKAMELQFIGGVYGGNIKPTQFMCLTLKMLQIQPDKDIVIEFIKNEEFKYVRALGAYYLRLTGTSLDCYKYLEPLYNDNRKLRRQNRTGQFEIVYIDDFIDELLKNNRVCDIILPRIAKRSVLEENNELEPKVSALDEDLDDVPSEEEVVEPIEELVKKTKPNKKKERSRSPPQSSTVADRDKKKQSEKERISDRDRNDKTRRDRDRGDHHRERVEQRDREHRDYRSGNDRKRDDYRHNNTSKDYRASGDNRSEIRHSDKERDRRRDRDRRRH